MYDLIHLSSGSSQLWKVNMWNMKFSRQFPASILGLWTTDALPPRGGRFSFKFNAANPVKLLHNHYIIIKIFHISSFLNSTKFSQLRVFFQYLTKFFKPILSVLLRVWTRTPKLFARSIFLFELIHLLVPVHLSKEPDNSEMLLFSLLTSFDGR